MKIPTAVTTMLACLFLLAIQSQAIADGVVKALSVDHSTGAQGQYFNFDNAAVDKIICNQTWGGTRVPIRNNSTGKVSTAILWRKPNGGSLGDGHGRWDDGSAAANQWRAGQTFTILNTSTIKVLSANHSSGKTGQYFNFNTKDIDKMLGRTDWNNQTFLIQDNKRPGVGAVILWRSANGAAVGDGHGRFANGAAPNQWAVNDLVSIIPAQSLRVESVDHTSGNTGKYFNFYISKVDAALKTTDWGGKKLTVMDSKSGRTSTAILWRSANGGSVGDGHGRWDDGSAKNGQWKTGDLFLIMR